MGAAPQPMTIREALVRHPVARTILLKRRSPSPSPVAFGLRSARRGAEKESTTALVRLHRLSLQMQSRLRRGDVSKRRRHLCPMCPARRLPLHLPLCDLKLTIRPRHRARHGRNGCGRDLRQILLPELLAHRSPRHQARHGRHGCERDLRQIPLPQLLAHRSHSPQPAVLQVPNASKQVLTQATLEVGWASVRTLRCTTPV